MKAFIVHLLLVCSFFFTGSIIPAFAAAPDGAGPWADAVISFSQGQTKDGSAISASRSDSSQALGVAESTIVEGTFVSLGFGGSITLKFDNGIANGVFVVESTNPGYGTETSHIEFSADGTTWTSAGDLSQSGSVSQPREVSCAQYVRITDTSNKDNFSENTADGYDVDGIEATQGESCTPVTPTPTVSPTPTDAPTPTPTPSETPTPTADPTPPPSNNGGGGPGDGLSDGRSDGHSSCPECTAPPKSSSNVLGATTDGQVLGASTDTLAATGSSNQLIQIAIAVSAAVVFYVVGYLLQNHEIFHSSK